MPNNAKQVQQKHIVMIHILTYIYRRYKSVEGITLLFSSGVLSLIHLGSLFVSIRFYSSAIVVSSDRVVTFGHMIGNILLIVNEFPEFLGKPASTVCTSRSVIFGLLLCAITSLILSRTQNIIIIPLKKQSK